MVLVLTSSTLSFAATGAVREKLETTSGARLRNRDHRVLLIFGFGFCAAFKLGCAFGLFDFVLQTRSQLKLYRKFVCYFFSGDGQDSGLAKYFSHDQVTQHSRGSGGLSQDSCVGCQCDYVFSQAHGSSIAREQDRLDTKTHATAQDVQCITNKAQVLTQHTALLFRRGYRIEGQMSFNDGDSFAFEHRFLIRRNLHDYGFVGFGEMLPFREGNRDELDVFVIGLKTKCLTPSERLRRVR